MESIRRIGPLVKRYAHESTLPQSINDDMFAPPPFVPPTDASYQPPASRLSNYDTSLDSLYDNGTKVALEQAVRARGAKTMKPKSRVQASAMGHAPHQAAALVAPDPMTDEELEAYTHKIRKNATHPFLTKAAICLNCEYFLAYKCGEDGKHRNLCTFKSVSPWNKSYTCANSCCSQYIEKGTTPINTTAKNKSAESKSNDAPNSSEATSDAQECLHFEPAENSVVELQNTEDGE